MQGAGVPLCSACGVRKKKEGSSPCENNDLWSCHHDAAHILFMIITESNAPLTQTLSRCSWLLQPVEPVFASEELTAVRRVGALLAAVASLKDKKLSTQLLLSSLMSPSLHDLSWLASFAVTAADSMAGWCCMHRLQSCFIWDFCLTAAVSGQISSVAAVNPFVHSPVELLRWGGEGSGRIFVAERLLAARWWQI